MEKPIIFSSLRWSNFAGMRLVEFSFLCYCSKLNGIGTYYVDTSHSSQRLQNIERKQKEKHSSGTVITDDCFEHAAQHIASLFVMIWNSFMIPWNLWDQVEWSSSPSRTNSFQRKTVYGNEHFLAKFMIMLRIYFNRWQCLNQYGLENCIKIVDNIGIYHHKNIPHNTFWPHTQTHSNAFQYRMWTGWIWLISVCHRVVSVDIAIFFTAPASNRDIMQSENWFLSLQFIWHRMCECEIGYETFWHATKNS